MLVDQVVAHLEHIERAGGDEPEAGPVDALGGEADEAHQAFALQGLQPLQHPARGHDLSVRLLGVPGAVVLEDVDALHAQAGEALVRAAAHLTRVGGEELGRQGHLLAEGAQAHAEHALAGPVAVAGRGVEVVDAPFDGRCDGSDHLLGGGFQGRVPGAQIIGQPGGRAAKADLRDLQAGAAQLR